MSGIRLNDSGYLAAGAWPQESVIGSALYLRTHRGGFLTGKYKRDEETLEAVDMTLSQEEVEACESIRGVMA